MNSAVLLTLIAANLKQRRLATCDDRGIVTLTELGASQVVSNQLQDSLLWEVRGDELIPVKVK